MVDILFLGNSITLHPICDYWWGEWGMAATSSEEDYVHKIVDGINQDVNYTVVNFATWEIQSHARAEALALLDATMSKEFDYVIVQLGENIQNDETMETDYEELFRYCQSSSNHPKVCCISEFWTDQKKDDAKKKACLNTNSEYVDISDIASPFDGDYTEYMIGMNVFVNGDDGHDHLVEHEGVAKHPGDLGHKVIAERVLSKISQQ